MRVFTIKKITKIKNDSKRYDIEVEFNHNFFANDILVHNSQTRFIFAKNEINDEAFGKDHNVYISSKGLGDKGLFFKNNETNVIRCLLWKFLIGD